MKKNILKVRKFGILWCLATELVYDLILKESQENEDTNESSDDDLSDDDESSTEDEDDIDLKYVRVCLSAESFNEK